LQSHLEGDVEIAAEARIVRSRVANYRIGTGSLVEGVTALECRRRSAFGNGVGVATMNECGGRTVKIFDRLSAQVAYVMAVYRHRPQTIAALEKMVDAYAYISFQVALQQLKGFEILRDQHLRPIFGRIAECFECGGLRGG